MSNWKLGPDGVVGLGEVVDVGVVEVGEGAAFELPSGFETMPVSGVVVGGLVAVAGEVEGAGLCALELVTRAVLALVAGAVVVTAGAVELEAPALELVECWQPTPADRSKATSDSPLREFDLPIVPLGTKGEAGSGRAGQAF